MPTPIPLDALRAVALHAQRLDTPNGDAPDATAESVTEMVKHLSALQIDTLQRVARSHHVALWSRFGSHQREALYAATYVDGQRTLYEYWGHAASYLPLDEYRTRIPYMEKRRESASKWWQGWLAEPENQRVIEHVRERIREEGPLRAADFKHDGPERGTWWDWKPAKRALEYLFSIGELMIADRVNFQRVYDLRERVLPGWVDTTPTTREAAHRHHVEHAFRGLGVARAAQAAEYAYLQRGTTNPIVADLLADGTVVEVEGELADGSTAALAVHRDNLSLLDRAVAGEIAPRRTTFLSPFDSLFWASGRDEDFWGFRQVLEAYKPAKDRVWGYFSLPILHRDRLVGRFDPKLERKTGVLRLEQLHLEPGIEPSNELASDVAAAMRDFLAFHHADTLQIEQTTAPDFAKKLEAAL